MWFESDADWNRITYEPEAPFDFITVGTNPLDGMTLKSAQKYDAFLNVALEPLYSNDKKRPRPDTQYFHVPIDEDKFWGYKPFLDTKFILDNLYENKKSVYLHCHTGANRSPTIALFWIYSIIKDIEEANRILEPEGPGNKLKAIGYFQNLNFIPRELEEFYERYEKFGPNLEKILNTRPRIRTDFKPIKDFT